jgi:O-antigen ligase
LSLLTSSRQTIGAIAIYLFILLFMMIVGFTPETRRVILRRRSIALMSLAIGIVFFIAASSFINTVMITDTIASLQDSMSRRILDRTWSEILGTSARAIIYQDAWRIAAENPFFGIGPGMFLDSPMNTIGKHTHSGYLELLTAEGFLIISLVCAFLFLFIVFYVLKHESIKSNLYYIFLPFSIVMIFWMINLNDLIRDYMLWLSLVTVIISVNLTRGPRAINAQLARAER